IARQGQPEVQALKQRTRVDPILRHVRITVRRLITIKRLSHPRYPLMNGRAAVRVATQSAYGADGKLEWPLNLGAISFRRIKFRRSEDGAQGLAYVAVALCEGCGDAINQSRTRVVHDETTRQLRRNESSGRRMMRENVQN